jgi:hypothetical protein
MRCRLLLLVAVACDAGVPAKPAPIEKPAARTYPHEFADCPERIFARTDGVEVLATLRRHACYGQCPVYQAIVYRDGRVEYEGTSYVAQCLATAQLDLFTLGVLRGALDRSDLFSLHDTYLDADWTDASTVDISYQPTPGKRKVIQDYHGDEDAPHVLRVAEAALDMIVGTDRWVRVDLLASE